MFNANCASALVTVGSCIYERIGDTFVIGAIGPEAQKNKAGFDNAVSVAKARLAEIEL